MPKVVINTCYGGFSLSPKAVARMAKLQGRKCFFFRSQGAQGYERITMEEAAKSLFFTAFDTQRPPREDKDWHKMTKKEQEASNAAYERHHIDSGSGIKRDDPLLIQVVEELGAEAASGACADLKIVEIPDGVKWQIEEYDGREHIAEAHETWY